MDDVREEPGRPTSKVDVVLPAPAAAKRLDDLPPGTPEKLKPMLEVEIVPSDSAVIWVLKGNLDATTVTTFTGAVALCLGEPGLIIDLSGVQFIDGAGLTALVGAVRRAQDQRTPVAVVVPAGTLRKVLDDAGFDLLISMSERVDCALAEIHHDAKTSETVESPSKGDELVPSARGVGE
jgi:anti-anti-sigma factor